MKTVIETKVGDQLAARTNQLSNFPPTAEGVRLEYPAHTTITELASALVRLASEAGVTPDDLTAAFPAE